MKNPPGNDRELIKETSALKKRVRELERLEKEHSLARDALRKSEEKYRYLTESMNDIIWTTDLEMNTTYASPSIEKVLGFTIEERMRQPLVEQITPETLLMTAEILADELQDDPEKDPDRFMSLDLEYYHKDGSVKCLETRLSFVRDERGEPIGIYGLSRDVTERKEAQEDLKKAEEKYRLLFELESDAIFLIDNETGQIIEANNAASTLYGYTREELLKKKNSGLSAEPKQTRDATHKELNMVPLRYHRKKDGTVFPVEITATHLTWNGRRCHLAAIRDITRRKQAEDELEHQRRHLRLVIDTVPNYIFAKDIDGKFLLANRAVADVFGVDTEDVAGKTDLDYGATEEQKAIYNMADRAVIKSGRSLFIPEEQILRKDGTLGWFQTTKIPYKHLDSDKPAILGVSVDITDRKHAEERMLREREKLQTLSDNAPFGMVLIDKDGRFTYINSKFTQLFGYDLSDIPDGRMWFRKAYPDARYRHTVISTWIEDFRDNIPGEQKPRVFTVTCKDGTHKIVRFIPSVLVSGDYLMTCEDITEIRELESQLRHAQKMESIGTMAGGIAHDFNNILTSLMGYASLIQANTKEGGPLRRYVDQIVSASRKAVDLTQGLLTFSRQQPVSLVPLDLNNTIKMTKKLLKKLLTEDIELHTSFTQEDTVIMADRSQMDQILFNLVTNARDAMPKGGTITIKTGTAVIDNAFIGVHGFGKPGRYVLMSVSDTGTGMDEATREKIFDPFFTTKDIGKGTGLGLATVYGIMKQHGGYITVDSELDMGAVFHIYLPAAMTGADEQRSRTIPVEKGHETILVAEDNEGVRLFVLDALQEYGYKTIEAVDGEDAINKFRQNRGADLIIVDSVMPKKNGREVYEEIRRMAPGIKVLFTSGYTRDIVLDKGIEDGELDFIAKPIFLDDLLKKVREVLDRR